MRILSAVCRDPGQRRESMILVIGAGFSGRRPPILLSTSAARPLRAARWNHPSALEQALHGG
jgi:hypothetical protein